MSWRSEATNRLLHLDRSDGALRKLVGFWTFALLLVAVAAFMDRAVLITLILVGLICVCTVSAFFRPQLFRFLQNSTFWLSFMVGWALLKCLQSIRDRLFKPIYRSIKNFVSARFSRRKGPSSTNQN